MFHFKWLRYVQIFLILVGLSLLGCSTIRGEKSEAAVSPRSKEKQNEAPSEKTSEKEDLTRLDQLFSRGISQQNDFEIDAKKFLQIYPQSVYKQYVLLLLSQYYLKQERNFEAKELNSQVQKSTFQNNPSLYYEAVFLSAEIYESAGELERSLAALVEAERYQQNLKKRVQFFELPLRLSIAYSRLDQKDLSMKYLLQAEKGLEQFLREENQSRTDLARLYFEIGAGSLSQSYTDYYTDAKKFAKTNKFLLYVLNLNEPSYAEKAKAALIQQVTSLWNQAHSKGQESHLDLREWELEKFKKLADFSKVLTSIQMMEPIEGQLQNSYQGLFFVFIDEIQQKTFDEIYAQYRYTPPTDESFRHRVFRDFIELGTVETVEKK